MQTLSTHMRATLTLGLPLIGSNVAQVLVGVTDTVMLGWYSVEALAAVALGHTFFFTLFILGTGFSYAVMPKVAAALATGDAQAVRRISRMGLWISLLFALATLPLFIFAETILLAFGQPPEIAADAHAYLSIAGLGMIPAMFVAGLRAPLSALEHTRIVLWATLAGGAANVALNWVLIFGNLGAPELGLKGAAIASLFVHAVMALILTLYAARRKGIAEYTFFVRLWRPDWPEFAQILRLGLPISLTLLAETGLFAASMVMMGWLGKIPLAAHGVALQIASLTFVVHMGLAAAATIRVGAAHGRQDGQGVRLAALAALILSAAMVAVTIAAFLLVPGVLVGAFISPDEPLRPEILSIGILLLALAALFQLFDAGQVMALGFLRGLQDTGVPMLFAFLGYWIVGLPAGYALGFPLGLGPAGIWLGLVFGLAVAGALMAHRFWRAQARQ